MTAVSTISALSTRLPTALVTMLSAMTPHALKAAIGTLFSKPHKTAHAIGSSRVTQLLSTLRAPTARSCGWLHGEMVYDPERAPRG